MPLRADFTDSDLTALVHALHHNDLANAAALVELLSNKGTASGYAGLDASGLLLVTVVPLLDFSKISTGIVPITQIPTGATSSTVSLGSHSHGGAVTALRSKMTSAQAFTSNATFANLTGMSAAVAASSEYDFDGYVFYDGGQTGDIKLQWTGPAGATILGSATGPAASIASATAPSQDSTHVFDTFSVGKGFGCAATGVSNCIRMSITVVTGVTSGTLQLQAAQNVSDATATTVHVGSLLEGYKL